MTTVLVTGFEPFGPFATNPTGALVERLEAEPPPGVRVRTAVLPVAYGRACADLLAGVEDVRPDAVVCCGLAARDAAVAVERIAINVMDRGNGAGLADNDGAEPRDEPIVPGGPDGLFATVPVRAIADALQAAGIPTVVSSTAGTFVCNAVLYALLHHLRERSSPVRAGFLHFPRSPELAVDDPRSPSMSLELMQRALGVALETVARSPAGSAVA